MDENVKVASVCLYHL